MARKHMLLANWKMNGVPSGVAPYFQTFQAALEGHALAPSLTLGFAVPYPLLPSLKIHAPAGTLILAQNIHEKEAGAYTGEVAWPMLEELGVEGSLLGHSERRQYFQETSEQVAHKLATCLARGHSGVACIGETLAERERGDTFAVLTAQLTPLIPLLQRSTAPILAYEPVWAIGTGVSASPAQAQEVHAWLRAFLITHCGPEKKDAILLYGGSVNPANIEALLAQPDIDGGLVGGASLQPGDFAKLALAFTRGRF